MLSTPNLRYLVTITVLLYVSLLKHASADIFYAMTYDAGEFLTIDPLTGQGFVIGENSVVHWEALEIDSDGSLIGTADRGSDLANNLYQVDPNTGQATRLGTVFGFPWIEAWH